MQLRRPGFQLLVLLMTLAATEREGATGEPPALIDPSTSASQVLSPQDNAALIGKRSLPDLVTNENAAMLGFQDKGEASSVTIGKPFEVYQVDLLGLKDFDPARDSVIGLLKKMDSLIYPLLTVRKEDGEDPKTRSALVVSLRKDKTTWTPTNWGLSLLAQATTKYREEARDKGFASALVVWIPALNLHFLGNKPLNEDLLLIPLAPRLAYGLRKGVPISARIVFALYALEAKSLDLENPG